MRTTGESLLATPVSRAFDELAPQYDQQWTDSTIGRLQRKAVWRLLDRTFEPGDRILDLGCGTGIDAVYLARQGMLVHAVDVAPSMVAITRRRAEDEGLGNRLRAQVLGIEDLGLLEGMHVFDGVLSNFSPLNCVADFKPVAAQLARLVRPGGKLVLCVMTRFCLWETLWYPFKGTLTKAARRWRSRDPEAGAGTTERFPVYYRSAQQMEAALAPDFELVHREGVGVFVPPSYVEPMASRFPSVLEALARIDRIVARWPLFRSLGDHCLLIFERRG